MENSQFSSSYFEITYYPSNHSIFYQIDGTSLMTGKLVANYSIIVYGLDVYDGSINLCDFGIKTMCPMQAGHLDVSGTYNITASEVNSVPGIAYTVPNLDAYVQVHIYDVGDNGNNSTMLACIQAPLTNGRTVQTRYAGWPIAVISGFGLVVSSIFSLFGHSTTAAHIASNAGSLFIYFQSLAVIAMMGVAKVPPIASAWAQNFVWTLGIIKANFMQKMVYWYVQATGGSVTSILSNESVISISVQKKMRSLARKFTRHLVKRGVSVVGGSTNDVLSDSSLYTTDEKQIGSKILVLRGIQRAAYLAQIEISNIFMTSMIFFLFVGFVIIVAVALIRGVAQFTKSSSKSGRMDGFREHWTSIIKGLIFRLISITFSQLSLLCIFEFTRHDSGGCVVFAIVLGLLAWVLMCYAAVRIIVTGRASTQKHGNPAYLLYGNAKFLNKFGFIYSQYKASSYYWAPIALVYLFLRAFLIAVLQHHGKVCACMIFAIEVVYTIAVIWKRPFMDKRTNVFNIFICIVSLINSILFLFFSNVFNQPPIVSSVAAVVYFVLNAAFAAILLIMTVFTCLFAILHRNPDSRYEPFKDDRNAFIPKSDNRKSKADYQLEALGATAMRGHDRNSMLPPAPEDNYYSQGNGIYNSANGTKGENYNAAGVAEANKYDADVRKSNPFDTTDNHQYYQSGQNNNSGSGLQFVNNNNNSNGNYSNAGYNGNSNNNGYEYGNNEDYAYSKRRRGAENANASNRNEPFYQQQSYSKRELI